MVSRRRKRLREEGTLMKNGALLLTEDHPLESPSGATGGLGHSTNRWRERVGQEGRTLDTLERE
ncbi:hypothetical protein GGP70_002969 [Salinibacter ruber]|nr:hypothetical protein [Salinibacter ruber]